MTARRRRPVARGRGRPTLVTAVAVLSIAAACGGGDDEAATTTPFDTSFGRGPEALAGEFDTDLEPGTARIAVGQTVDAVVTVTTCALHPGPSTTDASAPLTLVLVEGSSEEGDRIGLEVRRNQTRTVSAESLTDTVTVTVGPAAAPTEVLQAQRVEVNGAVTDGRDPEAAGPLLVVGTDTVEARGVFAPPGHFADDGGLQHGRVLVRC